jgi:hypothetical protein
VKKKDQEDSISPVLQQVLPLVMPLPVPLLASILPNSVLKNNKRIKSKLPLMLVRIQMVSKKPKLKLLSQPQLKPRNELEKIEILFANYQRDM